MIEKIWAAPYELAARTATLWARYWRKHGQDRAYASPYWC